MEACALNDKAFGIYQIKNLITGQIYVGSTSQSFKKRWGFWGTVLRQGNYNNRHLQAAWNKYGESNFEFSILEIVPRKEIVIEREQFYIDLLKPEYNKAPIAGSSLRCKHTEETKKNLSLMRQGSKNPMYGMSGPLNPFYGKTHSRELCESRSLNCSWLKEFTLTSPTGERISSKNVRRFARENNLDQSAVLRVISGKSKTHKGWSK